MNRGNFIGFFTFFFPYKFTESQHNQHHIILRLIKELLVLLQPVVNGRTKNEIRGEIVILEPKVCHW